MADYVIAFDYCQSDRCGSGGMHFHDYQWARYLDRLRPEELKRLKAKAYRERVSVSMAAIEWGVMRRTDQPAEAVTEPKGR